MKIQKRKSKNAIIKQALKVLSNKEHWTQGASALTKEGVMAAPSDPDADRFCVSGCLRACSVDDVAYDAAYVCVNKTARENYQYGMITLNDEMGYDTVIELLEKCVEICK